MATDTLTERAPAADPSETSGSTLDRVLGHPAAYVATALILLAVYAWPFISDQARVAPTKDPAFYTWRTEALITEEPVTLLEIEGAKGMYAAGYRVAAPILGGMLRHLPGVGQLSVITFIMVGLPVLIALLLAGFAYRHRPDPVLFHSVAFATGGLLLTPPFVGYLDNVLCLFWLAASLFFIEGTRRSWTSRFTFGLFLLLAGLTHPTTLAIFCVVLGGMAVVRLLYRRFDLRSVIRDDGWMLLSAFGAAVLTFLIWTVGVWGKSVSLSEAALPPPYDSDFFVDRMVLWVKAMTPVLNGPLFLLGVVGLFLAARREAEAEDELARVSIVWLAPLAGLFGFVGGLTYPYYRFFNTTLAWVLLVGIGGWILVRFLPGRVAIVGLLAIGALYGFNFAKGMDLSGWTNPNNQWLPPQTREDLDALRTELAEVDEDTPVVFVVDDDASKGFQIYGSSKLAGNIGRYGLPEGMIDQGYVYLGSVDNFLAGEPTTVDGNETYNELSPALLEEFEENAGDAEPVVVLASAFNVAGANTEIASGGPAPEGVWVVRDGTVSRGATTTDVAPSESTPPVTHLVRVLAGLFLLLLPGLIAYHRVLPTGELPEALGLVPAISAGLLAVSGIVVLAVARAPFSMAFAWITLGVAVGAAFLLGRRPPAPAA